MESILIHHHENTDAADLYGFWIYILSDCILFATIFAVYAALHNNLYSGASIKQFVDLHSIFIETMALLTSSFTCGLAAISLYKNKLRQTQGWLLLTFMLGSVFIYLEISEFVHLYLDSYRWQNSAALSAFFTLVGTHGLHVFFGLLWIAVMFFQLGFFGITSVTQRRLMYLGLFWAFLDIIWIFVFTIVYLMGAL